jgi:Spy/CpxP family protein refolding chaperone
MGGADYTDSTLAGPERTFIGGIDMRNRTLFTIGTIALAILIAAPFAFAQRRAMHGQANGLDAPMMFGRLERAKKALDLSDEQVSQIRTIFSDLRSQNAPYRESLRTGFGTAFQALLANPNDTAAAQLAVDQQTAAERTMKTNTINAVSKALTVLTPEQRAKLAAFVQERRARRDGR